MRRYSERALIRIGITTVVMATLVLLLAMNLQKLPGMRGASFLAEFTDASGLHSGNMVQVAGIRVGRVNAIKIVGEHVEVRFDVKPGIRLGKDTTASIEVLNVLGEKFLRLGPRGEGSLRAGSRIPLERTEASYDIVRVFTDLSTTTEEIDLPQLRKSLNVAATTLEQGSDAAGAAFDGISRLAETIASRDDELGALLTSAAQVSSTLAENRKSVASILRNGDLFLAELKARRGAIHDLLAQTKAMSEQLTGLVKDNTKALGPLLRDLETITQLLTDKKKELDATLKAVGPYISVLGNVVGNGPWFDATAVNLLGIPTGEFQPGYDG